MPTKNKKKKSTPKKVTKKPAAIAGMFFFGLAAAIIVFVIVAKYIIVNECASPCSGYNEVCPAVCVRESLWDSITKSMKEILASKDRKDNPGLPVARNSYTVYSVYQYGDVNIDVNNDGSISVEHNEDIVCVTTPCPQPRVREHVAFSDHNMSLVYGFLNRLYSDAKYDDLSFQDKRILMSMINDDEDVIEEYEFTYYVDTIRYHIRETSGEISIVYEDRWNNIEIDMTQEDKEDIEMARDLIYDYCERKNNYLVQMQSYDFIPEEQRAKINYLLHLVEEEE